ncbi:MAG: arginine repressor [Actinomycetota bacterium]
MAADGGPQGAMKASRQRQIVRLIRETPVTSQTQLVKILRATGYPATQATVSRDLDELGAVKVRRAGKVAYALPGESVAVPAGDAFGRMFSESILELETSGNIVVVKTPPGHAGMVGGALDRLGIEGVAGTVAGDDTILIVCKAGVMPRRIEKRLRGLVEAIPGVEPLEEPDEEIS